MQITRKLYRQIAQVLAKHNPDQGLVADLIRVLASANPAFDEYKFRSAIELYQVNNEEVI